MSAFISQFHYHNYIVSNSHELNMTAKFTITTINVLKLTLSKQMHHCWLRFSWHDILKYAKLLSSCQQTLKKKAKFWNFAKTNIGLPDLLKNTCDQMIFSNSGCLWMKAHWRLILHTWAYKSRPNSIKPQTHNGHQQRLAM